MNGQDLLEALSHVDGTMVEAAGAEKPRGRPRGRWLLAAACVCVLLAGSALAAEQIFGTSVTEIFHREGESGYSVAAEPAFYPLDELSSPQLTETLDIIQQQYRDYQPWDSRSPGWHKVELEDWEACQTFLGVELFNPLEGWEGAEDLSSVATPLTAEGSPPHCEVNVYADSVGGLEYVTAHSCYERRDCRISLTLHFQGENSSFDPGLTVVYEGNADFQTESRRLADGQEATVVAERGEDAKYTAMRAYFTRDSVIYDLSVWRWGPKEEPANREAAARSVLEEVLALF